MGKLISFALNLTVLVTTLSAMTGVGFVRCAHTGKIHLEYFSVEDECGMSIDSGCMEHILAKIQDDVAVSSFELPPVSWQLADAVQFPSLVPQVWSRGLSAPAFFPDVGKDPPDLLLHKLVVSRS